LQAEKIHRAETIQINTFDRELIPALCARLTRRMSFELVVAEQDLYVSFGEETINGSLVRHGIGKG
jgi:uncharacterized protein YaeQ